MKILNKYLDRMARAEVRLLRVKRTPFQVCAYAGLALCIILATALASRFGLSYRVLAVLVLSSVSTYVVLINVTEKITGQDRLTYYHHMMAVMLVAAGALWLMGQPVLSYLDVTVLGLGVLLACGRLGCLMVGCCHGRPSCLGICYGEGHTAIGFTHYLAGVRLFPIQGVELLWVIGLVVAGTALALSDLQPGETMSTFVTLYASGRFCFEFLRGDPPRPYLGGFSEAQWTSLILACAVALGELSGHLVFHTWHALAAAGLVFAVIAIALARRFRKTARHRLLHPRHVDEVARAVEWVAEPGPARIVTLDQIPAPAPIRIGTTSLGIQISAGTIDQDGSCVYHYALSSQAGTLSEETVKTVARLILQLKHPSEANELMRGNRGVFHLLVHS